ncbi:MAG: rhomboid family intramembrane serine protease [Pirellula sp.]
MGIYDREYYRDEGIRLQPDWNGRSAISYLVILNIAVFVANILLSKGGFTSQNQGIVNELLALRDSNATQPWMWWRVLSYAFVHDSSQIFHLLFNMLGLYFLGRSVEDKYGKLEFLRIYLMTAIVCGSLWLVKSFALNTPQTEILLGASGAVICIEMLFVLNFPKETVYLFVFPIPSWVLGVFLVLSNLVSSPSTGVAVDVHVVGILFAFAYFFLGWNFGFLQDLQGTFRRAKRKLLGPKLRVHQENGATDDAEADRILQKIHEQGKDSLTSKERKFMEKYSRRVRERKQQIP